jgi:hypothetical protein
MAPGGVWLRPSKPLSSLQQQQQQRNQTTTAVNQIQMFQRIGNGNLSKRKKKKSRAQERKR